MLHAEQVVGVLPLKDADAFRASVARVVMAATGQPPAQQTVAGVRTQMLMMPPVIIAYLEDRAVIAIDPATIEGYVKWTRSGGAAMAEEPPDATGLLYLDIGLLTRSYPTPEPGMQLLFTLGRQGRDVRFGVTHQGETPSLARAYFGSTAIMAAMLMPALSRARMAARKAVGMSNLHNIGLGLMLYANAHGRYPAGLEELVDEGCIDDPEVLVDPSDDNPRPIGEQGYLCSYEYPGALPTDLPPPFIIAYTRQGVHPGGRSVLYVDGAVSFVSEAELRRPDGGRGMSLAECYQWLVDNGGGELTDAQKAQFRRFYEVSGG